MTSPEQSNQSGESQQSSYGEHMSKLTQELQKMADETKQEAEHNRSFKLKFSEHYADMDSDYYKHENARRAEGGKVQMNKYIADGHEIVTLASIKVDSEGKTIDGHDYDPRSRNATDIEAAFDRFISETKNPIVIYEGRSRGPYDSRNQAISGGTESGLIQHLAREHGIEAVSGEPSDQEIMQGLVDAGYERSEVEAYLLSRILPSLLEKDPDAAKDLGIHLHPKAAELGLDGYHAYSPQEREIITKQGATEQVFRRMNQQVQEYVPAINELYGQDILVISHDGTVCLREDLQNEKGMQELWKILSGGNQLRQGLLRDSMKIRDEQIIETISKLHSQGYDVIMPYGGSHVVTQRPVMEAYYDPPVEQNY